MTPLTLYSEIRIIYTALDLGQCQFCSNETKFHTAVQFQTVEIVRATFQEWCLCLTSTYHYPRSGVLNFLMWDEITYPLPNLNGATE